MKTGVRRRRCSLRALAALVAASGCLAAQAQPTASSALQAPTQVSALPGLVARIKPSVLPIGVYSETANPRFGFRGTGFVVGDGSLVATNFHVLPPLAGLENSGPKLVVMVSRNGEQATLKSARLVASDEARDLAVLKLEGITLTPLTLEEPGATLEGQSIAVMGFPIGGTLGFAPVTHRGIIASLTTAALPAPRAQSLSANTLRRLRDGNNLELLQLDATAYPGNSGGPVFNAETGRVVGLLNMVLLKSGRESALNDPTGISYAVPVHYLQALLKDLR